ncbi:hypothetical protein CRENBAI_017562 [Crenichthys baileyi]|uniref:Anaphylatoxin-like domain-containing protein n=1 Tax=Crenichthys baileyi TaxID=28760 RepID=A0AAV9SIM2_9TELE
MKRVLLLLLASLAFASLGDGANLKVMSAPSLVRVGTTENIFVECQDCAGGDIVVSINVMNYPTKSKTLARTSVTLNSGNNFQGFGKVTTPEEIIIPHEPVALNSGMFSGDYKLAEIASPGLWKVVAKFKSNPQQRYIAEFEVKEYVLPSFEVKLLPLVPFFYVDSEQLTINIKATYLFGREVHGTAYVVFGIMKDGVKKSLPHSLTRVPVTNGEGQATLKKDQITKSFQDVLSLVGKSIFVSVSVLTESGSEMVETELRGIQIVTSPYKITFTRTPKFFKPGMSFDVTVEVVNPDETPAESIPVVVSPGNVRGTTAANGMARLAINTGKMDSNLRITISSRGQLIKSERYKGKGQAIISLILEITKEMLPSFRIIAYYHPTDNEVVSDSVWVDVKDSCMGSLTLESARPVASYEPRRMFNLKVTGDPGAKVGLVAVDKGVYVLNNKHRLTQKKVWDIVEKHDTGCTPGGGSNSMNVFYDAGLVFESSTASGTPYRQELKCKTTSKRKRDTTIMEVRTTLLSQYDNELQRECCLDGMKDIPVSYTCEQRKEYIVDGKACADAFLQCCTMMETQMSERKEESLKLARRICVSEPLEVIVRKEFFIDLRLPYSAVRGEQLEIKAILHNYTPEPITARVELIEEENVCSVASKRGKYRQEIRVGAQTTRSVPFVIIPMKDGERRIEVKASVKDSSLNDGVSKMLRVVGKGEPSCPDGTFFSGYAMDSWHQWKIVCLTTMSVEDVEDLYIIGFLITGFLLFGDGGYLAYRKICKTSAAVQSTPKLPGMLEGIFRALSTQTDMLREQNRKLDAILEQNRRLAAFPRIKDLATLAVYKVETLPPPPLHNCVLHRDRLSKAMSVMNGPESKHCMQAVPEGVLIKQPQTLTLNPALRGGTQVETLNSGISRADLVPNSPTSTHVSVTGREQVSGLVEKAISGRSMGTLIYQPTGCGEQNMAAMSMPVIAATYLDKTNQWEAVGLNKRNEALQHIRTGYSNQLNYRKKDGSFSIWRDSPSSTWLTAYVAKVFALAYNLVAVQDDDICGAVKFLILNAQKPDGLCGEVGIVTSGQMVGGVRGMDSDASMTAFCLIAMQESRRICSGSIGSLASSINKAVDYLEGRLPSLTNSYAVAITSYALANENKLNREILYKFASPVTSV